MRGRSGAGRKQVKRRRGKAARRRHAPTSARRRGPVPADRETEVARLGRERDEALEREKATSEVLRIIKTSPGELAPVFIAILDNALRLCEAAFGFVATYDGERFERIAQQGVPEPLAAYFNAGIDQPRPGGHCPRRRHRSGSAG